MKPSSPLLLSLPKRNLMSLLLNRLSPYCYWIILHPNTQSNCQLFMFCLVSFIYCVSTEAWPHEWRQCPAATYNLPHFPHLGEGRGSGGEWRGGQEQLPGEGHGGRTRNKAKGGGQHEGTGRIKRCSEALVSQQHTHTHPIITGLLRQAGTDPSSVIWHDKSKIIAILMITHQHQEHYKQ